jgi:dUTP pyrophosphatase
MQEFFEAQELTALNENLDEYEDQIPLTEDQNYTDQADTENSDNTNLNEINAYSESHSILKSSPNYLPSNKTTRTVTFDPATKLPVDTQFIATTSVDPTRQQITPPARKNIKRGVIDCAASHDMFPFSEFFESITPFNTNDVNCPKAMMGDEQTLVPISGHGFVNYFMHGHRIRHHAYYTPKMGQTILLSTKQHMRSQGCYLHAEGGNTLLAYPDFIIHPRVTDEIDVLIKPAKTSTAPLAFDRSTTPKIAITQRVGWVTNTQQHPTEIEYSVLPHTMLPFLQTAESVKKHSTTVKIKKLIPTAVIPTRATEGSIGYDVSTITSTVINPGIIAKIPTGLATAIPKGMYLRIAPRSSMSLKHLTIEGGVVDQDYRNEIKILIKNNSTKPISIHSGQKIAQFIFEKAHTPCIEPVKSLPPTTRMGGFGSTTTRTETPKMQSHRISNEEVILNIKSHKKQKIRRIARPIVQPLIHPNDKKHHQSPHKDNIQQRKNSQFSTTKDCNSSRLHNQPSAFDMQIQQQTHSLIDKQIQQQQSNNHINPPTVQQHSSTPTVVTPPALPANRVNSSQSKATSMSQADLLRSIGFLKSNNLQKHMPRLGRKNFSIQRLPRSPKLEGGEVSTMHSNKRNKKTLPVDQNSSTTWNIDIGFGPCTAIGGIKYTLLAVNKKTRQKLIYGLTNLKESLYTAMNRFLIQCGQKPTLIRTDFDRKLIGGKVRQLLDERQIAIEASPPYRQHQNGLVERYWQTIVSMTRNWLQAALLPSKYWFFWSQTSL